MRKGHFRLWLLLAAVISFILLVIAADEQLKPDALPSLRSVYNRSGAVGKTVKKKGIEQFPESAGFSVLFFDVGEGDAALVTCDGHSMLIDGGDPEYSSLLYSYLKSHQITYLDAVVLTHPHIDHVGGLAGALTFARTGKAYSPVTDYSSRAFAGFVQALSSQGVSITVPAPGDSFSLGSAEITFLAPVDMSLGAEDMNNISIILRVTYGKTSFLFTGDAEEPEEASMLAAGTDIRATLLKAGHHGSFSSSTDAFLKAVRPQAAVISVGRDNEWGHPHAGPLKRIGQYAREIYRTDLNGAIVCVSDGSRLEFYTEK